MPTPPAGPLTILVVDDDADMRLYLTGCLRDVGGVMPRVIEAANGREALHLAHALLPDLVVSDVMMPGLDGIAFCRALKADPRTAMIPFLLISGKTRAPPPCADGFLEKPFNAAGLRLHVERLLLRRP